MAHILKAVAIFLGRRKLKGMNTHDTHQDFSELRNRIRKGGAEKYHEKNTAKGKGFARDRIASLTDSNSFVEDGLFANVGDPKLPADGVITGLARMDGRAVAIMANDFTVKAGSWGIRTVEKIVRIQEQALRYRIPMIYLVDSAGARITDQIQMFPGRRHAGRIFHMQIKLSGLVPQICCLFGPSAAGGAYIPAFCDVVFMTKKNSAMYLGSPRMAEMVIGEKVTLEEMGGARMHTGESGCADFLCKDEDEALTLTKHYLGYFPQHAGDTTPASKEVVAPKSEKIDELIPADEGQLFDVTKVVEQIVDEGSLLQIKKRFAKELFTGLARLNGEVVGVVANNSKHKGGVLFVDSADKGAKFMSLCDAFDIPLLFLVDVPGFMIGSKVEKEGIIRHGAKMLFNMSRSTVPRICVVLRKAYGAGLYAMSGPAFEPDCTIALPQASIAVMGAEAAVNAVYANKIAEVPEAERAEFVEGLRTQYREDINIQKLADELVIDAITPAAELREELIKRFAFAKDKKVEALPKKHGVMPV